MSVFLYQSLHKSPFFLTDYEIAYLPISDYFTDTLMRLPLYFELASISLISFNLINEN
jgi:dTDP-4-amino-4,6-dideoxygalactose transaminase